MKITPNRPFLDGYDRYEPGQVYDVPDQVGAFFIDRGWADAGDRRGQRKGPWSEAAAVVTMTPDDSTQGQGG